MTDDTALDDPEREDDENEGTLEEPREEDEGGEEQTDPVPDA
jgi:hypothetical protein